MAQGFVQGNGQSWSPGSQALAEVWGGGCPDGTARKETGPGGLAPGQGFLERWGWGGRVRLSCPPPACPVAVLATGWTLVLTWAARAARRGRSMPAQSRCHFIDDASGHFVQSRWLDALSHNPQSEGSGSRGGSEPLFPSTLFRVGVEDSTDPREARWGQPGS